MNKVGEPKLNNRGARGSDLECAQCDGMADPPTYAIRGSR